MPDSDTYIRKAALAALAAVVVSAISALVNVAGGPWKGILIILASVMGAAAFWFLLMEAPVVRGFKQDLRAKFGAKREAHRMREWQATHWRSVGGLALVLSSPANSQTHFVARIKMVFPRYIRTIETDWISSAPSHRREEAAFEFPTQFATDIPLLDLPKGKYLVYWNVEGDKKIKKDRFYWSQFGLQERGILPKLRNQIKRYRKAALDP